MNQPKTSKWSRFVAGNFVLQSPKILRGLSRPVQPSSGCARTRRLRTSAEWFRLFKANADRSRPIPWERGAEATPQQLEAIVRSLQAWQLGETSDGNHLRAA